MTYFENNRRDEKLYNIPENNVENIKKLHTRFGNLNVIDLKLLSQKKIVCGLRVNRPKNFRCVICRKFTPYS